MSLSCTYLESPSCQDQFPKRLVYVLSRDGSCGQCSLVRLDQGVQKPIFFISKTLVEVETHYLPLEKAVLVIIHAVHKLAYYFQAHIVVVLTEHPLQALLRRSDFTGRVAKWGVFFRSF